MTGLVFIFMAMQLLRRDDFDHRLGVVWSDDQQACLAIDAAGLKVDAQVFVTSLGDPAETFVGLAGDAVHECGNLNGFSNFYRLGFPSPRRPIGLAAAALGVFATERRGVGVVRFRLTPAPTRHLLEFHACTRAETSEIHVWSTYPEPGTPVWSRRLTGRNPGVPPCSP